MAQAISQMTAAGSLAGTELVEVAKLSTSVTITATTISAQASDNSFNDSGSGLVAAGFAVGDRVRVQGFTGDTANNMFSALVTTLTAGKMVIGGTDGDVIVDDAAGESVTITKWETRRTTAAELTGASGVSSVNGAAGAVSLNGGHIGVKGADIASAATVDLSTATGDWVDVTGTTAITAFGTGASGIERLVRFTGVLTLTHNATSLILPGAANITTAAGDFARLRSLGSGNWVCVSYQRASGLSALQCIPIACSDESTPLTTGTAKVTFHMPFAFNLTGISAGVTVAPTGADLIVDVNEAGTSIMTTNKLRIDAGEESTHTAATPPALTDTVLAAGSKITIDIDQIGSTIAGAGLKVYLLGRPA